MSDKPENDGNIVFMPCTARAMSEESVLLRVELLGEDVDFVRIYNALRTCFSLTKSRARMRHRLTRRPFALSSVMLMASTVILFKIFLQNITRKLRARGPKDCQIRKDQILVTHAQHLCHLLNGIVALSKGERVVVDP